MKIRIEIDRQIEEDEIIFRSKEYSQEIQNMEKLLSEMVSPKGKVVFYRGEEEFYISLEEILFFETDESGICAHTTNEIYRVKHRLYELEDLLPRHFVRVSKSTILNIRRIYSMDHNLSSYSVVRFRDTHKQVYVSRRYHKHLKMSLQERVHSS